MANKELKENILGWLQLDNDIKSLQKQIKEKRKEKKDITDNIVVVMKSNEIECFDAGSNGKLIYHQQKTKAPLSKKHLLSSLSQYFDGNDGDVQKLAKYILDSRKDKVKETIKRKIKKQ
tara:strand:- start:778 stop:1134 length:357 start_codon:yes stop_codon:yes gene_type:complete